MIGADTNILVSAHRRDSPFHRRAAAALAELAASGRPWAIPWPCVREFYSVATHPRVYAPPSTPLQACDQVDAWLESPGLTLIGEGGAHWKTLRGLLVEGRVPGPLVHDAAIAALCLAHGVHEFWTVDRDFSRFPALRVRNPLVR